ASRCVAADEVPKPLLIRKMGFFADCGGDASYGPSDPPHPARDNDPPTWTRSWRSRGRQLQRPSTCSPVLQLFWRVALDYGWSVGHSGDSPFDPSGNSDSSQNQLLVFRSNGQPVETSQLGHLSCCYRGDLRPTLAAKTK